MVSSTYYRKTQISVLINHPLPHVIKRPNYLKKTFKFSKNRIPSSFSTPKTNIHVIKYKCDVFYSLIANNFLNQIKKKYT